MICATCGEIVPPESSRCKHCGAERAVLRAETILSSAPAGQHKEDTTLPLRPGEGTAWSIPHPSPPGGTHMLQPGDILADRYEIRRILGKGGMGSVFQAWDQELDRMVAIKVIRAELAEDPEVLRRFKQELILARQVTHRNVIRIFDLGHEQSVKFITMEYVEGRDLRTILVEKGKLAAEESVSIVRQICLALEASHAENVIHRDLKPQNVMLDGHGKVVVMDFGIARSLEASSGTRTGTLLGTPEYMSPEQAKGDKIDTRSDLFSLGIIFYEMLTGQMPYQSETAMGTLLKRIQERAVPVVQVDGTIPRDLSDIVAKCLASNPAERYQTAAEILNDLDAWQGLTPAVAAPAAAFLKTAAPKWIFAAAVLLTVSIVFLVFFRSKSPQPAEAGKLVTILIADFENKTSDAVFDGTIESTFTLAMEGAPLIASYRRGDARKIAAQLQPGASHLDEGLAKLVARREGINVIISGNIAPRAGGYDLSVRAIDAVSDKVIISKTATAAGKDQVLLQVGKLAAPVRKSLGDVTPESAQTAALETFSAGNIEAAHEYSKAQEFQWAGRVEDAVAGYKRAVELDPKMGRAYAGLGAVSANLGQRQASEQYYKLAMANLDRMSEREKYRTLGGYYISTRNADKAIEMLTNLVRMFPSDSSGYTNLAYAYSLRRDLPKAVETGKRAVDVFPKNLLLRNNLAIYALYAGEFETSQREARAVLEANPQFVKAHLVIALSSLAQGLPDEARKAYHALESLGSTGQSFAASGLADISLYEGRNAEAAAILSRQIQSDLAANNVSLAASRMAVLATAQLQLKEKALASATADRARQLTKADTISFDLARFYVEAGDESRARTIAADLAGQIQPEPQAYGKLIEGELKLRSRNAREAAKLFVEASKLVDTWIGRLALGRAYLDAGAFTEAQAELDLALKRHGEATALYLDEMPTYRLLPPVHFYLGCARRGLNSPGTPDSFRAYLAIRKNADGDPLIADAQRFAAGR